ncbi:synaptonemal complex central element protein 2 [Thalassophryne amazonica]|uniref:synaptonemal complex central element protein 2 n=1 Tax=Thalassophryne amazonica TaxID=390379 RepID=UPI001470AC96|nr:synaptonemal complex central element protein 2 [Thalassophryne amazonica]
MAQTFHSNEGADRGRHLVVAHEKDPFGGQEINLSIPQEDTLGFVIPEDNQKKHSISESSEDPVSEPSAEMTAEAEFCSYPVDEKIEEIWKKAQDLIEKINQRRAADQEIIASFEHELLNKVTAICHGIREQMLESYDKQSQARLQEVTEVLERCGQLDSELQDVSQTLSVINTGLLQTPRP